MGSCNQLAEPLFFSAHGMNKHHPLMGLTDQKALFAKVELVDGRQAYCHFGATWSVHSWQAKGTKPPPQCQVLIFGLIKGQWWLNVVNSLLIRPAISWGDGIGGGPFDFHESLWF